ncbi:MAG: low molecular weight protein arginine phosphatase [Verrucomicrobiota bacterium]
MEENQKVLFVCTGNVCRSPMAEGLLRAMVEGSGKSIQVHSAGLGAMDGSPPSSHSVEAMAEDGVDISSQRSQMLTPETVEESTHIFGLGSGHAEAIRAYFPESREKTFVLREFIAEEGFDLEVPDPIGGDLDDYRATRNLIKEAMPSIFSFLVTGDPTPRVED